MVAKKCYREVKGVMREGYVKVFEHRTKGFYAKISKLPEGKYSVMEYVGNSSFPASPPTFKVKKTKQQAEKEAKRYINQYCD